MPVVHRSDERLSVTLEGQVFAKSNGASQGHIKPMQILFPQDLVGPISLRVFQAGEPPVLRE